MNPDVPPVVRRRRYWPWVLLAVVVAPLLVLAATVHSFVTLDRDTATLQRHVLRVTDADWKTTVQLSLGRVSFAALRGVLRFVDDPDLAEARLALTAIRRASVGVYERRGVAEDWSRAQLMTDADLAMSRRGWTRIVGVADGHEAILVYVPAAPEPDRICLSVVTDRELVVVSATLNPDALVELIKRHGEKDFRKALARLN